MFEEGHHYYNRSFGYKVIAIDADRMLVIKDGGEQAELSLNHQTRIQENMERDRLHRTSPQSKVVKRRSDKISQDISEFQKNSLVNFRAYRAGGIVVECTTCHTHSPILDVDELKEFYSIHPAHNTEVNDGYYDSDEIKSVLDATKTVHRQWKFRGQSKGRFV